DVFLERIHGESLSERGPWSAWELGQGSPSDSVEFAHRLLDTCLGAHARDHAQVMSPFAAAERDRRVVLMRGPQFGSRPLHVFELWRHDTDYREAIVIQRDIAADDGSIAIESPLPQLVAEDYDVRAVWQIFDRHEVAAQDRKDAEYVEKACADALAVETFGLVDASHRRLPRLHHRDGIEGSTALHDLAIRTERDVEVRAIHP